MVSKVSSGWYGNPQAHAEAGRKGGQKTSERYGESFYSNIGKKGGKKSSGNFKHNPQKAKTAGSKGGKMQSKRKVREIDE